jgi:hypothetical protein
MRVRNCTSTTRPKRLAGLFAALLVAWASPTLAAAADLPPAERQVLLDLYRSTDGANWSEHDGWDDPDGEDNYVCTWHGVICEEHWTHVQKLVLDNNNLVGTLPANLNTLTGLMALSLHGNQLSGPIPTLAGLKRLEYLELSRNALSGAIPDLGDLVAMESLNLGSNQLTGSLPKLAAMRHLQFFDVGSNHLSGTLPELTALVELKLFRAAGNRFSGPMPAIAGLPLLHDFFLEDNALDGAIPRLDDLPELRYFRVGNNRLTGPIPDLAGVPNLQELSVGGNRLDGALPKPPPRIATATLCPNALAHPSTDAANDGRWNKITRTDPWWRDCL